MINAFVLITIEDKNIRDMAHRLMRIPGVTETYPVAGVYDFVVVVRVNDNSTLSRVITEEIVCLPGIASTKTLFALDSYSRVDLDAVFGS
jgi:DNA-binding Lrp family transcriptional regulator